MKEIFVFDTYARAGNGTVLHFDVLLAINNNEVALKSAKKWLGSINSPNEYLTQIDCQFCHLQSETPEVERNISKNGYHIIKLEGFDLVDKFI